jgi:hypothetical protein
LLLFFASLAAALPPGALAHAELLKAQPARRAAETRAPTQVRLWFNEEIEAAYTSVTVLDAAHEPVTAEKPHAAADDPKSIVLPLPALKPGQYTVKFRVLSVDGHVVDSSYEFTVEGNPAPK